MRNLDTVITRLFENILKDLPCGIYLKLDNKKYFLIASNSKEFPPFLKEINSQNYLPYYFLDDYLLILFPTDFTITERMKEFLDFAKEYINNYLYKAYFETIGSSLHNIEIPYLTSKTLGSALKNLVPNSSLFIWLKREKGFFYKIIYSYPELKETHTSFFYLPESDIIDINSIGDYSLKEILKRGNVKWLKIKSCEKENIFLWGFNNLPLIKKEIDEFIERFLPENFMFLDYVEILIEKIYPRVYESFREFIKDLQNEIKEKGEKFSAYFKISLTFLEDDFYIDENGIFKKETPEPEKLFKFKNALGEITYYLSLKNMPFIFIKAFENKLNEISYFLFIKNLEKQLESLQEIEKFLEEKISIETLQKKFEQYIRDERLRRIAKKILVYFQSLIQTQKKTEKMLKIYKEFSQITRTILELFTQEENLSYTISLFFKFLKESYKEISQIIWIEKERDKIENFFSSTKLIREHEFSKALDMDENPVKWGNYYLLKTFLPAQKKEYILCFLFESFPEKEEYLDFMRMLNLLLYTLLNYKRFGSEITEVQELVKDLPLKFRVMKRVFSLPEKAEYILLCRKEKINLHELIQNVLNEEIVEIRKKKINVELLEKEKFFIEGYEPLLKHAFSTLFKELINYNRIKGRLSITIDGRKKILHIEDTGIGLSDSQRKELTSPSPGSEKEFNIIGEIFKIHNFSLKVEVERGIGNKLIFSL